MEVWRARVLTAEHPDEVRYEADARVAVADGRFTAVGPWAGGACDLDLRGEGVLVPGFVDAHVHLPQSRIVGAASGPLLDWLKTSTFPEEARFADRAHADAVSQAFTVALRQAGTTFAMAYGSVHHGAAEAMFEALDRSGLRALAGPVWMDEGAPEALLRPPEASEATVEALVDRWHGHEDRLGVAVVPRFALSCSAGAMRRAAAVAERHDLVVTTHLSEHPDECRAACEVHGAPDYLAVYEDVGLLRPGAVFAHCIHLSDDEWDRFAAAEAVVAHCPDSNDFLGSGGMPLDPVIGRGVRLALGTDVAAGRSFRVGHVASSAFDNALRQGRRTAPARWLWVATVGGATALGVPDTGRIAPGFRADAAVHPVPPWVDEAEGVLAHLLLTRDAGPVARMWVQGRAVDVPQGPWWRGLPAR